MSEKSRRWQTPQPPIELKDPWEGRADRPDMRRVEDPIENDFRRVELLRNAPILDLHGMAQDEAWAEVEVFLRDQQRLGETVVRIMPGVGKGILRAMLEKKLPKCKHAKKFRNSIEPNMILVHL